MTSTSVYLFILIILMHDYAVSYQTIPDTDMCIWGLDFFDYYNGLYRNSGHLFNGRPYYFKQGPNCNCWPSTSTVCITYLAYFKYYEISNQFKYRWGISTSLSNPYWFPNDWSFPHNCNNYTTCNERAIYYYCDKIGSSPDSACGQNSHSLGMHGIYCPHDNCNEDFGYITSNSEPDSIACPKSNCSSIDVIDTGSVSCSGHFAQDGYLKYFKTMHMDESNYQIIWYFNVYKFQWSCIQTRFSHSGFDAVDLTVGECGLSYTNFPEEHWMDDGFDKIFTPQGLGYSNGQYNARFTCNGFSDKQYNMKLPTSPTTPAPTMEPITAAPTILTDEPTSTPSMPPTSFTYSPSSNPALSPILVDVVSTNVEDVTTKESKNLNVISVVVIVVIISIVGFMFIFRYIYRQNKMKKQLITLESINEKAKIKDKNELLINKSNVTVPTIDKE